MPASRERLSIRSALLLSLAFIGVAMTSWDAGDGRSWSRLVVLGLGVVLCFAYALGKPRGKAGDEHASIITKSGTAFGIVVVLTWLLFLALRSVP